MSEKSKYEKLSAYYDFAREVRLSSQFKTLASACQIEGVRIAAESAEAPSDNVNFSALSLMSALGMALEGASPEARNEILDSLCGGTADWGLISKDLVTVLKLASMNPNAKSMIANLAAINKDRSLTEVGKGYLERIERIFGAVVEQLDFASPELAQYLSDQIAEKTKGKLKPNIDLSPLALFVLINTLYLKASWVEEFDTAETKPQIFHGPEEDFKAQFMRGELYKTSVYIGDSFERIELPLEGDYVCKLVLPKAGVPLRDLLQEPDWLHRALHEGNGDVYDINVELPRFEIKASLDAVPVLECLGFGFLFAQDGSGMLPLFDNPAYVDSAKQETYLKVNEEGLEGAAYTIMAVCAGCANFKKRKKRRIVFDRPFVFSVENWLGVPFFTGVVNNPESL